MQTPMTTHPIKTLRHRPYRPGRTVEWPIRRIMNRTPQPQTIITKLVRTNNLTRLKLMNLKTHKTILNKYGAGPRASEPMQ